jgi:metal-sulfur cluster biosynthetic enzyme
MCGVLDDGGEPNERSTPRASEDEATLTIDGALQRTLQTRRPKRGGIASRLNCMPTPEEVNDALSNVIDPELGLDFVELGLVYDVEIDGGKVDVTFTLTTPACPIGPQVTEQMIEFVSELEDVTEVNPKMTFSPPWSPDRMSEDAKFALGF